MIIREISTIAQNRIPTCLRAFCDKTGLDAWELLEEAAFYFFRQVLMLETRRLGANVLFTHEPEGLVFSTHTNPKFALMYECKARTEPYRMSSDDVLRYRDYIRNAHLETQVRDHLDLTHFVIVAPRFAGDIEERLHMLENEGIVVSLLPAALLASAYSCVKDMEYADIRLLKINQLFARGVLAADHVAGCLGAAPTPQ